MSDFKTPFIKKKGEAIYYSGTGKFVFIVPEMYFENNRAAISEGEYIYILGTIDYSIVKGDSTDVSKGIKQFFYPSFFYTKPGKIEKVKNLSLPNRNPEDYRLMYYEDNDVDQIVTSVLTPEDVENVESMNQLFIKTGHINKSIPYDRLQDYFFESAALNGTSYKKSAQLFGLLISELCRDPNNNNNPFRLSKAIQNSMVGYNTVSIVDIPKLISPYQSIVSENWDEAVIGAIMNDNNIASPMERIMTD